MDALRHPSKKPKSLSRTLEGDGGQYKSPQGVMDSAFFSVYTKVLFKQIVCDSRHGLAIEISFSAPSGRARQGNASARAAYWESVGRKRLIQGGLVALVWKVGPAEEDTRVYLGVVASSLDDLIKSAKNKDGRVGLRVSFFEPEAQKRILACLQRGEEGGGDMYLIEAPVMFESIRPFLETLKHRAPTSVPFARYLAHPISGSLQGVEIELPVYASRPGFTMDLSCLFDTPTRLILHPSDRDSIQRCRVKLTDDSRLDATQVDALLNTLTREVSLIQG